MRNCKNLFPAKFNAWEKVILVKHNSFKEIFEQTEKKNYKICIFTLFRSSIRIALSLQLLSLFVEKMIWYRSILSFLLVLDLWYWCKRVIKKAIKYNKKSEVQLSFPRNLIRAKLRKISDSWISNFIWILSNSTFQVHYEIKEIICTDETLYLR